MSDVFDLDAVSRERKAERAPFPFMFRGQQWELASLYSALDLDTIDAAQNGDLAMIRSAVTAGLGPEQAEQFGVGSLTVDEVVPLFERWTAASGSRPGESAASSGSSESTGRPSKPTSTGSTASASRRRSTAKPATPAQQDKATPGRRAKAAAVKAAIRPENF